MIREVEGRTVFRLREEARLWMPLRAPDLIATYRREPPGPSEPIEEVLRQLARYEATSRLFVGTHLGGHIVLTTASDYTQEENRPAVWIVRRREGTFGVGYVEPHESEKAGRDCSAAELQAVVEALVQRLLVPHEDP